MAAAPSSRGFWLTGLRCGSTGDGCRKRYWSAQMSIAAKEKAKQWNDETSRKCKVEDRYDCQDAQIHDPGGQSDSAWACLRILVQFCLARQNNGCRGGRVKTAQRCHPKPARCGSPIALGEIACIGKCTHNE